MEDFLTLTNKGMSRAKLINYILFWFIIFAMIFGLLYYFALSPDKLFYSIVPVTISKSNLPEFDFAFYGQGENKIKNPMDLAINGNNVYISDSEADKILVFDLNGRFKSSFGKAGKEKGELNFPYGIAIDETGRVIVSDMKNHRVQVFNSEGKFLSYFPNSQNKDVFNYPGGLSIINNLVYITDIYKNKIFVFDLKGNKLQEFGSYGTKEGQFKYPNGVTADNKGNIYVSDTGNNRVQVFSKDGQFIRQITGAKIDGIEERYASPRGVVTLKDDFLFVVSNMSNQIWASDLNGQFYYRFGERGEDNDKFYFPYGLEINKNKLYIADYQNHSIKVYKF